MRAELQKPGDSVSGGVCTPVLDSLTAGQEVCVHAAADLREVHRNERRIRLKSSPPGKKIQGDKLAKSFQLQTRPSRFLHPSTLPKTRARASEAAWAPACTRTCAGCEWVFEAGHGSTAGEGTSLSRGERRLRLLTPAPSSRDHSGGVPGVPVAHGGKRSPSRQLWDDDVTFPPVTARQVRIRTLLYTLSLLVLRP